MAHHIKPGRTHRHLLTTPQVPTHGCRQHRHGPDPQHPGNPARHTTLRAGPPSRLGPTCPHGYLLPGPHSGWTRATLPATTGHLIQQPRLWAANQFAPLAAGHRRPQRPVPAQTHPDHAQGTDWPATAPAPASRSAQGLTQPDAPCSGRSLPATPPGTSTKQHAEPHPEDARRTRSR